MRHDWVLLITIPLLVALTLGWAADHYVMRTELTKQWGLYAQEKAAHEECEARK